MLRAEGWAACARDQVAAAAHLLSNAATFVEVMPGLAALLAYDALLAGSPATDAGCVLRDVAGRCDAPLLDAYAAHAEALAARSGATLLDVADRFASIGASRYGMVAASQAAHAYLEVGRDDLAREAAARARALHEPGQGTKPPEIDGLGPPATALTSRESQLVAHARQGLTNAEIADLLAVSIRTVETHLYRAMHKLGVHDRRDL